MLKKIAELKVDKYDDYYGEVVAALEKDGFIIIKELETTGDIHYMIAKDENEKYE